MNQPPPMPANEEMVQIHNKGSVPCVGGPANGARIKYGGNPHEVRVERPPTILTVNPQSTFEHALYHACFFRIEDKAYVIYRHESMTDSEAILTIFNQYGRFDTRKPRGQDSGREGKGFH